MGWPEIMIWAGSITLTLFVGGVTFSNPADTRAKIKAAFIAVASLVIPVFCIALGIRLLVWP